MICPKIYLRHQRAKNEKGPTHDADPYEIKKIWSVIIFNIGELPHRLRLLLHHNC